MNKLGFGLMRLPMKDGEVDLPQLADMADCFLGAGCNYFDTAWSYLGGRSEPAFRKAVAERYPRDRYRLATKLQAWLAKNQEEAQAMFDTSLERTGAGYFDRYLLHNLGDQRTDTYNRYHIWEFLAEKKSQGLIRELGFSFHSDAASLDRLLREHPEVDFVQLQINYADWNSPDVQSRLCYETARRYNKPVLVMEPVKGGVLANLPEKAEAMLRAVHPDWSPVDWALKFAAGLDGVDTVLSGMSSLRQMQENLRTLSGTAMLTQEERRFLLDQVAPVLEQPGRIFCTNCGYCTARCPRNILIPKLFEARNLETLYGLQETARTNYLIHTRMTGRGLASQCVGCGQCEQACPQHLPIRSLLREIAARYETDFSQPDSSPEQKGDRI